jgi:ABC-type antimicrobial peptide transport system permease subunit
MASSDSSPALPKKSWLRLLKPKGQGANISVVFMLLGILITGAFIAIALLTPALQSWGILQDPTAALTNPIHEPPGAEHLLGTTRQGYDVLSRVLFGTRAAWQVVLLATAMSVVVGVPLGMVSGYLGRSSGPGAAVFYGHYLYAAGVAAVRHPGLCGRSRRSQCRRGPEHCLRAPVLPGGSQPYS